jgi:hypothetical protein
MQGLLAVKLFHRSDEIAPDARKCDGDLIYQHDGQWHEQLSTTS